MMLWDTTPQCFGMLLSLRHDIRIWTLSRLSLSRTPTAPHPCRVRAISVHGSRILGMYTETKAPSLVMFETATTLRRSSSQILRPSVSTGAIAPCTFDDISSRAVAAAHICCELCHGARLCMCQLLVYLPTPRPRSTRGGAVI